jgi:hypothetical protein
MRTTEITEEISVAKMVARNQWATYEMIEHYLKNNGYKIIGTGSYSETYAKANETFVIKVAYLPDRTWLKFVELTHTDKANPHFPKISRVRRYASEDGYAFIAFVERLAPITTDTPDIHLLAAYMINLIGNLPDDKFAASSIKRRHKLFWNDYTYSIARKKWEENENLLHTLCAEFERKYPRFVGTIQTVIQNAGEHTIDLHDENIMVRPRDNTFVIMDPYS